MEIWRDVPGYEGLYQVSNYGRVKSLNYKCTGKERILKTSIGGSDHLKVTLSKNGKGKHIYVHILIAVAFIPNPHNYNVVHHIDHNPLNNRVENLIWINHKRHIIEHKGKIVYQYTLDGELVAVWETASEAAKLLGYNLTEIAHCCNGGYFDKSRNKWHKRETYKGYIWSYIPL